MNNNFHKRRGMFIRWIGGCRLWHRCDIFEIDRQFDIHIHIIQILSDKERSAICHVAKIKKNNPQQQDKSTLLLRHLLRWSVPWKNTLSNDLMLNKGRTRVTIQVIESLWVCPIQLVRKSPLAVFKTSPHICPELQLHPEQTFGTYDRVQKWFESKYVRICMYHKYTIWRRQVTKDVLCTPRNLFPGIKICSSKFQP